MTTTTHPDGTILIVDDEPNVRLMFRTALEAAGWRAAEASGGAEALDRAARDALDLILLDLRMPDLDGLEVLRRLREAGDDVPVVMITAHGSIPDAVAAMKLGAIDFVSKPVTPERLRAIVSEVLARSDAAARVPPEAPALADAVPGLLAGAKWALNRRQFDRAAVILETVIERHPDEVEPNYLLGLLHERAGELHAAYQFYRAALALDRTYQPALDALRQYCERQGLDFRSPQINPAAEAAPAEPARPPRPWFSWGRRAENR